MPPANNSGNRTRELELALFEKIETSLGELHADMRDVRERVIRIEAQDVQGKLTSLELRVSTLEKWQSRVVGQIAIAVIPISAAVGVLIKLAFDLIGK